MSTLYEIKAEKIDGASVLLEVNAVHPDSLYIPAEASFALMILREASDESALSKEVAFEDTLDEAWMKKFAKGFVRAVAVTDVKNEGKRGMRARMHVTVSHPAWIAHLKPGASWDSAAFDVVREYDDHEPIAPEAPKAANVVSLDAHEEMFIWVVRDLHGRPDFARLTACLDFRREGS